MSDPNMKSPVPCSEVLEELWTLVDFARLALLKENQQENLISLADAEKMLRRAIVTFYGQDGEAYLRQGIDKHPYILQWEKADEEAFEQRLIERAAKGLST